MDYKVGIGYDVHRFVKGRKLFLGGVEIPYKKGLSGHSDADVVLHSICDAILGALGMDDIGVHFPDSDIKFKNVSSKILLEKVFAFCEKKKYKLSNLDIVIIAEEPKINPWKTKMKQVISKILNTENINIKSTTNEKLGFIGNKQGIACFSSVLIYKNKFKL